MSNALIEAMALKKCCIVSNIPQNCTVIKNYFNGLIFKLNDEKDLYQKILWLFKEN